MRVLQSEREPNERTNPYISQVFEHLREAGVVVLPWSSRNALFGKYDILHFHWPEFAVRKRSPLRTIVSQIVFVATLALAKLRRRPIVWTVHNSQPHERLTRTAQQVLDVFLRRVAGEVHMTPATVASSPDKMKVLIPHGDYRAWYSGLETATAQPGQIGFVGLIRPYKGLENLISQFGSLDRQDARLVISGQASDAEYFQLLVDLQRLDSRVEIHGDFLDNADLVRAITSSELIAIPYQRLVNSGALILALSMSRPVLAPLGPTTEWIRSFVGAEWLHLFEGELTREDISQALDAARSVGTVAPDLSAFDWKVGTQRLLEFYVELLEVA